MPAGRNGSDIGVIMKPEGSMKICVLNGSRQVDKVVGGEWQTQKGIAGGRFAKGIYQLSEARKRASRTFIRIPM